MSTHKKEAKFRHKAAFYVIPFITTMGSSLIGIVLALRISKPTKEIVNQSNFAVAAVAPFGSMIRATPRLVFGGALGGPPKEMWFHHTFVGAHMGSVRSQGGLVGLGVGLKVSTKYIENYEWKK